jgi:two-component system sensor histidine kinase YesM
MVRLTLQPLVENCFQHAFPRGIEAHHTIRIDARRDGEQFLVIVEDNGVGIAPDKLAKLTDKLKMNRLAEISTKDVYHRGGIGLINVHRRIQMVFGEAYGIEVESTAGEGTRVIMTMPADWNLKRI